MATTKTNYKTDKQKYTPSKGEKVLSETKVIPHEAFTVREMLIKSANGTLYDNVKTPFYEEQAIFSTKPLNVIQSMDLPEKLIYLNEVRQSAKALETKVKEYHDQQQAKQQQNNTPLEGGVGTGGATTTETP